MNGLEFSPFVRSVVGIKTNIPLPEGLARTEFNLVLRYVTAMFNLLLPMIITGMAAEGIASERAKDTLPGLLTTPLTGRDILLGKALGALWRAQGALWTVVALWFLGLISGAVHPIGFLAALLGLALAVWFALAVGSYGSMWSADLKEVNNRVTLPAMMLSFLAFWPYVMPKGLGTVFLGVFSPACHTYLSLVSYEDVRDASPGAVFGPLASAGVTVTGEGYQEVVIATCLIGWALLAARRLLVHVRLRPGLRPGRRPPFRGKVRVARSPRSSESPERVPAEAVC